MKAINDAGRYTLEIISDANRYNTWLYKKFEAFVGQNILEVGSGIGNMTRFFLNRHSITATDIAEGYLKELKASFSDYKNVKICYCNLEEPNNSLSIDGFDTVICLNVLEHIKNDKTALRKMYDLLQVDGKLILFVPAGMLLYSEIDRNLGHFRRYDIKWIRQMLKDTGFRIIHSKYYNIIGAVGWFFNGRILRKKYLHQNQVGLFNLLVPILKIEEIFSPNFGMSILVIAGK